MGKKDKDDMFEQPEVAKVNTGTIKVRSSILIDKDIEIKAGVSIQFDKTGTANVSEVAWEALKDFIKAFRIERIG